jgi:EpsD family peptidyl-prolyl cis-trans isomerase
MDICRFVRGKTVLCRILVLASVVGLSGCGNKEKNGGQALARVNGVEITSLQINDELMRAGVKPEQREVSAPQLLESLIDRQLIVDEATRNNIHRSPEVLQEIERAKAQIIAQAYIRNIEAKITKPTQAEIEDYFLKHPEYFIQRKQYDLQQIVIANGDFSNELKLVMDSAKSLDSVATWMDIHHIRYARGQLSRTTADLPELMVEKLKNMKKNELFIFNDGENSILNCITNVKTSPVAAKDVTRQIEQYLINSKTAQVENARIAQLRSQSKIEYLNASAPIVR